MSAPEKKKKKGRLQFRFLIGLVVMGMVLLTAVTVLVGYLFRNSMEDYYTKTAFDAATIAAEAVDGDALKTYVEDFRQFFLEHDEGYASFEEQNGTPRDYYDVLPLLYRYVQTLSGKEKNETYLALLDEFVAYREGNEAYSSYREIDDILLYIKQTVETEYCYVVFPGEEQMFYIWDAGDTGEEGVCLFGTWENYYGDGHKVMRGAYLRPGEKQILVTRDYVYGYGYLASAYVAVTDGEGVPVALSCVDISMDKINTRITQFSLMILAVTLLIILLFILAYYLFIRHQVLQPIEKLRQASSSLASLQASGRLDTLDVNVKTGDELETLGDAFQTMARDLQENINNLTAVTAEKERIGAELDVAKHIQASMLPCIFPAFPNRKDLDIYAMMDPAKEVGGDFYDFFMVDENHLAIVMADVSGKGIPAALFMVIGKTLIKDHTQMGVDLGEVFGKVNNMLCEANSEGLFITAFEGILDLKTGQFDYVNAGHEMPFLYRKETGYVLQKIKPGFVLAGMENMKYRAGSFRLEPGDRIFQYTDGVTEATDIRNRLYGMERLQEALNASADMTPEETLRYVKKDVEQFVGEAPQFDDITMLCLEYKGKAE